MGERFCLSGPGITGTRTLVVGSDGVLRTTVTLPSTSGPATYTLTGRDGAKTQVVAVQSSGVRGSVTGVRLTGPAGFRQAGTKAVLEVTGAAAGARYQLRGPGLDVTVVAGSDGGLTRSVTLPDATATASYVLFGENGQVADDTRVLGTKTLKVSTLDADGPRTRVLVRKLAAGEKVKIVVAGKTLAKGRANTKGRFVTRVKLPTGKAKVRVRAVGQFPALRSGSTSGDAAVMSSLLRRAVIALLLAVAGSEPRARVGPRGQRGDVHVRGRGQRGRRLPRARRRHRHRLRGRRRRQERRPRSSPRSASSWRYATRQPGFVCRVNGVPASDPCVNASPVERLLGTLVGRRLARRRGRTRPTAPAA